MRVLLSIPAAVLLSALLCAHAQQKLQPSEILAAAAENGAKLTAALRDISYYEETTIESVTDANTIAGTYYRLSQISFDSQGNRREKILENKSTLRDDAHIGATTANNLIRIYQFIITPETLNQYEIGYIGRERIDEVGTYVFDVRPKTLPTSDKGPDRYVKGRVWIDDEDLCVVKVAGQPLPQQSARNASKFESYFQDHGKYWFPSYATADETLRIGRYEERFLVKVRFTGYKKTSTRQ